MILLPQEKLIILNSFLVFSLCGYVALFFLARAYRTFSLIHLRIFCFTSSLFFESSAIFAVFKKYKTGFHKFIFHSSFIMYSLVITYSVWTKKTDFYFIPLYSFSPLFPFFSAPLFKSFLYFILRPWHWRRWNYTELVTFLYSPSCSIFSFFFASLLHATWQHSTIDDHVKIVCVSLEKCKNYFQLLWMKIWQWPLMKVIDNAERFSKFKKFGKIKKEFKNGLKIIFSCILLLFWSLMF